MTAEARALTALLVRECDLLRRGEYDDLAQIAEEKARLVRDITARPPSSGEMLRLHAGLRRNARLIAAAVAGFRAATGRVAEMRQAAAGFSSYAADGRSAMITAGAAPGFVRRA